MKITVSPRKKDDTSGIACLPLASNVSDEEAKAKGWKKVSCPFCGGKCWETPLATKQILKRTKAACTTCALFMAVSAAPEE